jgi:hypothetical protein
MSTIACVCPPTEAGETRHPDGDTVTLRERLDLRGALTARNTVRLMDGDRDAAAVLAALTEAYLLVGVESWSLVDAKGEPIPVTPAAIREHLLSRPEAAILLADEADERYSGTVLLPLLDRVLKSSPPTPTNGSTYPPTASPTKRPKPSKPSSTITSQTAATSVTSASPGGASSSLPS